MEFCFEHFRKSEFGKMFVKHLCYSKIEMEKESVLSWLE